MMVVAPTFQSVDNAITVPEVNSGTSIEQGKVTVSVTKDGSIYVGDKRSSITSLSNDLTAVKGNNDKAEVVVKADEKVKSSIIMDIMDAAQDAHYKKLIVAGEPLNKKEQKKLEDAQQSNHTAQQIDTKNNQYEDWSE